MSDSMKRTSFSLPPELIGDLDFVSKRIGISRSALVAGILKEACQPMVALIREIPEEPTASDAVRFRGESQRVVNERVDAVLRLRDDLFSELGRADD